MTKKAWLLFRFPISPPFSVVSACSAVNPNGSELRPCKSVRLRVCTMTPPAKIVQWTPWSSSEGPAGMGRGRVSGGKHQGPEVYSDDPGG